MSSSAKSTPHEENGPCATREEKVAAFEKLKDEDYGKLLSFAEFMAMKLKGRISHSDADDLLQEAIVRVLESGNIRKWYPLKVDFLAFLRGCIRSIASDWYEQARNTESPDELASPIRHDAQTEAAMTIERIRKALKGRPHAVEILDLKCEGLKAREIQERLGISPQIYAAAVKWIVRGLRKKGYRQ